MVYRDRLRYAGGLRGPALRLEGVLAGSGEEAHGAAEPLVLRTFLFAEGSDLSQAGD
jgi:hypothetical protein